MNRRDRRLWAATRTLADVGELTAQWLEGRIASVPGYGGGPCEETLGLVPVLAAANRAGYVTISSQPGGSGPGWEQRAAVSGFADDLTWARLRVTCEEYEMCFVYGGASRWRTDYSAALPATRDRRGVVTRFGAALSRRHLSDPWTGYGQCHPHGIEAICNAWQVTLIDTEWGREDSPLWPALAEFSGVVTPL